MYGVTIGLISAFLLFFPALVALDVSLPDVSADDDLLLMLMLTALVSGAVAAGALSAGSAARGWLFAVGSAES